MNDAFGSLYAEGYDLMYQAKDYKAECDVLEGIWQQAGTNVSTVVDLGSGTGGHSLELAQRGYDVVGVDRSKQMVAIAETKKQTTGTENLSYVVSDLAEMQLERTFDAAIMMFNVIGYLADDAQRRAALQNVRRHLRPGGLFVFDFWYGPAVLRDPPSETFKELTVDQEKLLRTASTELDRDRQLCDITINVRKVAGPQLIREVSERHQVRFFFSGELSAALSDCGIELVRVTSFSNPRAPASPDEWPAIGVGLASTSYG